MGWGAMGRVPARVHGDLEVYRLAFDAALPL